MSSSVVVLTLSLLAGAALGQFQSAPREMKSDKEYKADLVKDGKPATPSAFDYPYPKPQESSAFDNDFVKDDNADQGEWAAQMEYDRLRAKMKYAERALERLKERADEAEKRYQDAQGEELNVQKEVVMGDLPEQIEAEEVKVETEEEVKKEAMEVAEATEDAAEAAEEAKPEEIPMPEKPKEIPMPQKPQVSITTKEMDDAVAQLKQCEQKVLDAKDQLMKSLEVREGLRKEKEAADAEATAAKGKSTEAKGAFDEATSKAKAANEEFVKADAKYKKEQQDVENLKGEVESAATRIKQLRSAAADSEGGVVSDSGLPLQSSALSSAGSVLMGFVMSCLAAVASL